MLEIYLSLYIYTPSMNFLLARETNFCFSIFAFIDQSAFTPSPPPAVLKFIRDLQTRIFDLRKKKKKKKNWKDQNQKIIPEIFSPPWFLIDIL